MVTLYFVTDVLRQTARNLRHDGALWRWSTWRSGFGFFFGRHGLVRHAFGPWRAYFKADFHPSKRGGPSTRAFPCLPAVRGARAPTS